MCAKCFQPPVRSPLRNALVKALRATREFDDVVFSGDRRAVADAREARRAALDRLLGEMLPILGVHVPPPDQWGDDDVISLGLPADLAGPDDAA